MAAHQQQPTEALKPHDHKVDILVLTMTNGNLSAQRACPCTYKGEGRRKQDVDIVADNVVLTREIIQYISSMSHLSHYLGMSLELPDLDGLESRLPKKREQAQLNIRSCSCDRGPDETSEIRAKEDWYSVVRCMQKDMAQRLHDVADCGDYDSFCLSVKQRPTCGGQWKGEIKLTASKKESGSKQTGDVHNGGAGDTKSKEADELKVKTSSKSNVNNELSTKIRLTVTVSRHPKETFVEKELKSAVEFDSSKKVDVTEKSSAEKTAKASEKSEAKLNLKATAEFDARKIPKAAKKSDAKLELKAAEESESKTEAKTNEASVFREKDFKASLESDTKRKVDATEVSDYRKKVGAAKESDFRKDTKATVQSSAKQELKAMKGKSTTGKEAAVAVDKSEAGKGADNPEEEELNRPGSKNVRTCMNSYCGLQESAPKMFKKCKRCKDEGCMDPPYYCGRDCQVLDWTTRHRQEHEKSCAEDPAIS